MNENYSELSTVGIKKKAVKGAGINVSTQFINFLFQTLGVVLLARILTPKDFGLVTSVTAFSLLPLNFGFNGFTEYIIHKQIISKQEIDSIFWVHLVFATSLCIFFIIFGFFLVRFYHEPALNGIAFAISLTFILNAVSTTPRALLRREMKFSYIALGNFISTALSIFLAIGAAFIGMGYWAIVIRQTTGYVVQPIVAWKVTSWRPGRPRKLSSALPGVKYMLKVFANFSITYLTRSIDKILLGKFYGSEDLGHYDRAYYLTSLPASQLLIPLTSLSQATLSRLRNDKKRFIAYYTKAVSLVSFLGTIAALVLMLSADDLVPLLLGPGWAETATILIAFSPSISATLLGGTYSWLHISLGTPGRWLRWNIFEVSIFIISFVIAVQYGAVAMAVAFSVSRYVLVLPGIWYAGRPINLKIDSVLSSVFPYFIAGIIAFVIWTYFPQWCPRIHYNNLSPVTRVIMTFCIVPILYIVFVSILQCSFKSIRELLSLTKLFLSR